MPGNKRKFGLFKNKDGATALEFAMVAPMLIMFIFAIIEITYLMLLSGVLESAVRVASRQGITGYTPPGFTRDQYVKKVVEDNLIFLNPSSLQFTTLVYNTYANIGQPEPFTDTNSNGNYNAGEPYTDVNGNAQWDFDMGVAGAGGPGAIVVYKVTYPWQVIMPFIGQFFPKDANGNFNLTASMVVRNEPYE